MNLCNSKHRSTSTSTWAEVCCNQTKQLKTPVFRKMGHRCLFIYLFILFFISRLGYVLNQMGFEGNMWGGGLFPQVNQYVSCVVVNIYSQCLVFITLQPLCSFNIRIAQHWRSVSQRTSISGFGYTIKVLVGKSWHSASILTMPHGQLFWANKTRPLSKWMGRAPELNF